MKRYPKYKDSGVPWLGQVPEHWKLLRFKNLFTELDARRNLQLPSGSISYGKVVYKEEQEMHEPTKDSYQAVLKGEFLINPINLNYDLKSLRTALSEINVCVSPAYIVLNAAAKESILYLRHLLYAFDLHHMKTLGSGVRHTITFFDIGSCVAVLPPISEQEKIADFLGVQLSQMDSAIESQERMIELFKERRSAIITQAVTKGLNPNAKMKDSGVPWLGQVPAHWDIRKVSQLFRAGKGKNGQILTKEFCSLNKGDYPVYSGQTENEGVMGTWDKYEFDFGQSGVLFSTTVGAKAMYLRHLFGRFSLSQNCMIIWPISNRCEIRFFYYHFQPLFIWQRSMIPDHMQPSFRMEDLYLCIISLPPLKEQALIVEFLDKECKKIDSAISSQEQLIELLKERRSAIITQAVTGQIDVR